MSDTDKPLLPVSILVKRQVKEILRTVDGVEKVRIKIRWDDQCGNGHNSFSITGSHYEWNPSSLAGKGYWEEGSSGCIHDIIERMAPDLAHLIKWHLVGSDGPMHYLANTAYHVSDKNPWGRHVGDVTAIIFPVYEEGTYKSTVGRNIPEEVSYAHYKEGRIYFKGKEGNKYKEASKQEVQLLIINHCNEVKEGDPKLTKYIYCGPWWNFDFEDEGKTPHLEAGRKVAIWPEATLEQLRDPKALADRLPALMEEFKKDVEALDFIY